MGIHLTSVLEIFISKAILYHIQNNKNNARLKARPGIIDPALTSAAYGATSCPNMVLQMDNSV